MLGLALLAVCVALAFAYQDNTSRSYWLTLGTGVSAMALLVCFWRIYSHSRSLGILADALERIQKGEETSRLYFAGRKLKDYTGLIAATMEAASGFERRLQSLMQNRVDEEAVLSSMAEGVLVVSNEERLIRINDAAAEMLGLTASEVVGRVVQSFIRNLDIQRLIQSVLKSQTNIESSISLMGRDELHLQMNGRVLRNVEGEVVGALVVMSDVTRLRRLEQVRSDFIANVSHELRTPVTSIRGFVETLLDGALDNREDTVRFLGIIRRQADRLTEIFEDMLMLSRLEREEKIGVAQANIGEIVSGVIQTCGPRAAEKKIVVSCKREQTLLASVNAQLVEQAVLNLVDNAIKYSPSNTEVEIRFGILDGRPYIEVSDQGVGIDAQHLPRVFERFYRVDRGRSRSEGGTGLGLSIVKHIAQAHGGYADVESEVGKGSTFRICLGKISDSASLPEAGNT